MSERPGLPWLEEAAYGPESRAAALAARKAKHPDWNWGHTAPHLTAAHGSLKEAGKHPVGSLEHRIHFKTAELSMLHAAASMPEGHSLRPGVAAALRGHTHASPAAEENVKHYLDAAKKNLGAVLATGDEARRIRAAARAAQTAPPLTGRNPTTGAPRRRPGVGQAQRARRLPGA